MSESTEPAAKKIKTGFEGHTLNISEVVMKEDESKYFTDLIGASVSTMQGIGPKSTEVAEEMKLKTVEDLATFKYFLWARAIVTLAETETVGGRIDGSYLNINKMIDKNYETKSLKEMCDAPVSALQGVSDSCGALLATFHVKTVADLAVFKYCRYAEAIVLASKYGEEVGTEAERKTERMVKKLE